MVALLWEDKFILNNLREKLCLESQMVAISGGSRGGRRGPSPPPPKKEREREREVFRPSIKHISIHSFAC